MKTNPLKYFRRVSLRSLLILPFTLQLVGTVGLVGYLSHRSGQDAIETLANRLLEEVSDRGIQRLQTYVDAPQQINQIAADAVRSGELDFKNLEAVNRYFLSQIKRSELSSILFSNPQGEVRGIRVLEGEFQILEVDRKTPNKLSIYSTDSNGQKDKRLDTINYSGRDNLDRPWSVAALALKQPTQPTQNSVSLFKTPEDISLYATYALYDRLNKPLGAFAATLKLNGISEFLSKLKISQSGQVFVIDRAGNLVGNSFQEELFKLRNKSDPKAGFTQLNLENSSNPIAREVGEALKKRLGNLSQISRSQKLSFVFDRQRYFAEVVPFPDRHGLNWLMVTVLPDSEFTAVLQRNAQITVGLCLASLGGSVLLSTFVSIWMGRPLRRLSQAAQAIAAGDLEPQLRVDTPIFELKELSDALDQMTRKLRQALDRVRTDLQESKEKYATVFRSSPDAIGVIHHSENRWVEVNEGFVQQTEYTFEEVVGRPVDSLNLFTHPEKIEALRQQVKKTGVAENYEIDWRTKSGKPRVSLISVRLTHLGGERHRLFISKDITELKQAEAELREKDEFFHLIVTHIPDVLMIYDRDRRFQYINPVGLRKAGWNLEHCLGKRDEDLFLPEITRAYLPILQKVLETKTLQTGECTLQLPNATIETFIVKYVPLLNPQGEIHRIFGITYDITSRKRAENALQESEKQLRLLADALPVLISYVDREERYQFANKTYKSFFGIDRDLVRGKHLTEVIGEAYYHQVEGYIQRVLTGETVSYEATGLGKQKADVSVVLAPNIDENAQIRGFYVLAIDISDRRRVEQELQRSQEAAEAANRAKSAFLSSMSHELRTPLNAILGFAQLLSREDSLSRAQQNQIGTILRSGEHLLALVNDVLEMSKIDAGRMNLNLEDFDLHLFLEDLQAMLRQKAEVKGLEFHLERDAAVPQFICTDMVKLRQILINLLGNAIKFTQDGRVVLRVQVDSATPADNGTPLIFEVEDTGVGIETAELERIFEPFVQSELSLEFQQGTGLGLALSRRYAQLLGGAVTVNSNLDRGSVFRLSIAVPASEAVVPTTLAPRRVVGLAADQSCRLLVVEDQPDSRELMVLLLSGLGFEVREACNGQEAIDLWESWSPHLILMDMQMPVLNGYETARQIRAREQQQPAGNPNKPATPIIALTASVFEEQRAQILAAGCNAVVCKPFQAEALYEMIAQYSGRQYIYEESPQVTPQPQGTDATQPDFADLPIQRSDLEVMPPEWRQELHHAATRLFEHQCHELLALIPIEQVHLRVRLDRLIQEFRFDRLIELTRDS